MGRPREHGEETAQALLKAGEELLVERGVSAISVRAVAERAGTTTRAVYALFGSKASLVEAIAALGYRFLAESVDAIPRTAEPRVDLVAVGGVFRTFAVVRPALFRLTFERADGEVFSSDRVRRAAAAAYEALIALIHRAQESGDLDPGRTPDEIAYMIHAVCQGLAGSELAAQPPPIGASMWSRLGHHDRTESWDTVLNAVVDGLAP